MKKNIKIILLLFLFLAIPKNAKAFEIVPSGKNKYGETYNALTIDNLKEAINNSGETATISESSVHSIYNTREYIINYQRGGTYDQQSFYFNEKEKVRYIVYSQGSNLYVTFFPQRTYRYYNGTYFYTYQNIKEINFIREIIKNNNGIETWQQVKITKNDKNIIKTYTNYTNLLNDTNGETNEETTYHKINGFNGAKGISFDGIDLKYNYNTQKWEFTNLYLLDPKHTRFYKYSNKIGTAETENIKSFDNSIVTKVTWWTGDTNIGIIENNEIIKETEKEKYEIIDTTQEKETINENELIINKDTTNLIKNNFLQISKNENLYKIIITIFITSLIIIIKNKI